MEEKVLENLRMELRKHRGSIKMIAERSGKSREWVMLILNGKQKSESILKIAKAVLLEMRVAEREAAEREAAMLANLAAAL